MGKASAMFPQAVLAFSAAEPARQMHISSKHVKRVGTQTGHTEEHVLQNFENGFYGAQSTHTEDMSSGTLGKASVKFPRAAKHVEEQVLENGGTRLLGKTSAKFRTPWRSRSQEQAWRTLGKAPAKFPHASPSGLAAMPT